MIKDASYGSKDYLLDIGVPLTQIISSIPDDDLVTYRAYFDGVVEVVFMAKNNSHELFYTLDAALSSTGIAEIVPQPLDVTTFVAVPQGSALWQTFETTLGHGTTRQFSWEEIIADGVERDLCDPELN
jgi:hypothetical protein